MAKTRTFKAETHKVLNILTHSLYTNREIFLRELLSNASDALDKVRFLQNKGEQFKSDPNPLEIYITSDKENSILSISDNGFGMTATEMEENLGTIAKSGSEQFLKDHGKDKSSDSESSDDSDDTSDTEEIIERDEPNLDASQIIGRFGIGFYSVFMVASEVEVFSVPAAGDETGNVWKSKGQDNFSIRPMKKGDVELNRGTIIRAHIKDDAKEFLEDFRLESIIRGHSNFLPFPIFLNGKQINTTPALWREPKFSITKEQYKEFYSFLTYDNNEPFDTIHFSVDAPVQFSALLFIPDTSSDYFNEQKDEWGLDLYVNRVLIERSRQDILPNYFAFVKGVVDTEDLILNISRETLQETLVLQKISKTLVRQLMTHLERMASSDKEKYSKFWKRHGKYFKFAFNDYLYRDRVAPLLRFTSSACETDEIISFDDYIARAQSGQKDIWYVAASSREAARLNPHMERFRSKGIEVLYLLELVDELALESLEKYKNCTFRSIEKAQVKDLEDFIDVEEKKSNLPELSSEDKEVMNKMLVSMKELLGEKVKEIRLTDRLTGSPACLASLEGMNSSMEKLIRSMQKTDEIPEKILEVNPDHGLIRALLNIYKDNEQSNLFNDISRNMYDNILLLDGYINDPYGMAERNLRLMEEATQWYMDIRKV